MNTYEPFDMEKLENGEESMLENILRLTERVCEGLDDVFGSSIYTPAGEYTITIGPNLIDGGFMVLISVIRGGKRIAKGIMVEKPKTKDEALLAHNFWVTSIINNPPAVLKDVSTGNTVILK